MTRDRGSRDARRGQAVAEFALALIPLLLLIFGIFDLGRGIYLYNGVAEASREIARVTIVHPYDTCCTLGTSSDALATIAQQERVIPGLDGSGIAISCVDIADTTVAPASCTPSSSVKVFVKVRVTVSWTPASPLLVWLGALDVSSVARMELQ